jgi:uncharacterized phage protein (TIGR01671 family)
MREIEFRGKTDDGEWIYGDLTHNPRGQSFIIIGMCILRDVIPETVGQFTGFRDKNKKKVYEGDIVKAWSQGFCGTFEIKWREDGGGAPMYILYPAFQNGEMWYLSSSRLRDGFCYDEALEVIGNIVDNPELKKTGDEQK